MGEGRPATTVETYNTWETRELGGGGCRRESGGEKREDATGEPVTKEDKKLQRKRRFGT